MPIKACTLPGGGSGFQWGDHGHCYPTRAEAEKQAAAAHANGYAGDAEFAMDATLRTYDKEGRLHIARSHISKACVNPYFGREIPRSESLGLDPNRVYYLLRSPEELAKGAVTFARLPILSKHIPVATFDTMEESAKKQFIVGTIGSDVEFLAPYLDADVCIWDASAIAGIETDQVREFSCGYSYVPKMSPGTYEGEPYDGIMTEIQGNHLALVESGRAGRDVLAADSQIIRESTMEMTKLGKGLKVALSALFPKVKIAADSELEKKLASATSENFDKAGTRALVIAMDANIPPDQVDAVMDALVEVDKPAKDKKGARDEESEEEKKEREKKAADKKAKDEKDEKDKEEKKAEDDKKAMDARIDAFKKELKDADEARREVRLVVGDVIAQDSAAEIYTFALDQMKVDHTGVKDPASLRALFKLANEKKGPAPVVAMDAAAVDAIGKQFPNMGRFRQA